MGKLFYGMTSQPIEMDDSLLAHVAAVVATKLRRSESFTLTWQHSDGVAGRSMIWLQAAIPLRFVFDVVAAPKLDQQLLHKMALDANSTRGLILDDSLIPAPSSMTQEPQREPSRLGHAA